MTISRSLNSMKKYPDDDHDMLSIVVTAVICLIVYMCCGCLSVVRIPVPTQKKFSDECVCTNCVWAAPLRDIQSKNSDYAWRTYPTIDMRWYATSNIYGKPIDENLRGEDLYNARMAKRFAWFPLTILWLTSPLDGVVDTIALPFDLND